MLSASNFPKRAAMHQAQKIKGSVSDNRRDFSKTYTDRVDGKKPIQTRGGEDRLWKTQVGAKRQTFQRCRYVDIPQLKLATPLEVPPLHFCT
jgi:hypothetical protein